MTICLTKKPSGKKGPDGKKYVYWNFELSDGTSEHAGTTEKLFRRYMIGKKFELAQHMRQVRGINHALPENTNPNHELSERDI